MSKLTTQIVNFCDVNNLGYCINEYDDENNGEFTKHFKSYEGEHIQLHFTITPFFNECNFRFGKFNGKKCVKYLGSRLVEKKLSEFKIATLERSYNTYKSLNNNSSTDFSCSVWELDHKLGHFGLYIPC